MGSDWDKDWPRIWRRQRLWRTVGTVLCMVGLLLVFAAWLYALGHWPVPAEP